MLGRSKKEETLANLDTPGTLLGRARLSRSVKQGPNQHVGKLAGVSRDEGCNNNNNNSNNDDNSRGLQLKGRDGKWPSNWILNGKIHSNCSQIAAYFPATFGCGGAERAGKPEPEELCVRLPVPLYSGRGGAFPKQRRS